MLLKCITDGGLEAGPPAAVGFGGMGAKPPAVGRFFVMFWKKSYCILMPLDLISQVLSEPFESTRFLTFESQLKKLNCIILLFYFIITFIIFYCILLFLFYYTFFIYFYYDLQFKSKTRLTSCILEFNFNCK